MRRAVLPTLVLVAGLAGAAHPAAGYVRTLTSRGNPLSWHESCVFLVPQMEPPSGLTSAEVLSAIAAAAKSWTDVAGSYLRFVIEPAAPGLTAVYRESQANENVVVFVESGWPHDADAVALTTLTYLASSNSAVDGRFVDTDVEMNMEHFSFTTSGEVGKHDLENVLTHEIGHAVGLDHTCDDGFVVPTPTDHLGNTIPWCKPIEQLPLSIRAATMFNYADVEETDKRSLEPDDEAGISAIYPLAQDPGICAPPNLDDGETCHCGTEGPGRPSLPVVLAFGWLLAAWRRRRRRPPRASL